MAGDQAFACGRRPWAVGGIAGFIALALLMPNNRVQALDYYKPTVRCPIGPFTCAPPDKKRGVSLLLIRTFTPVVITNANFPKALGEYYIIQKPDNSLEFHHNSPEMPRLIAMMRNEGLSGGKLYGVNPRLARKLSLVKPGENLYVFKPRLLRTATPAPKKKASRSRNSPSSRHRPPKRDR